MDLASLDMNALGNQGAWVKIKGPDGAETDLQVQVRGAHSDQLRAVGEAHQRRISEAVKSNPDKVDFEALEKVRDREMAVASTIAWRGFEEGGKLLEATPENIARIYTHPGYGWLAAQVYAKAQEAKVFLKP